MLDKRVISTEKLWEIVYKSLELKSLIGSSIDPKVGEKQEAQFNFNLVVGHAYTIMGAFELIMQNGKYDNMRKNYKEVLTEKTIKLLK